MYIKLNAWTITTVVNKVAHVVICTCMSKKSKDGLRDGASARPDEIVQINEVKGCVKP